MPCSSDGYPDDNVVNADRATRAACDLVAAIRTERLWGEIEDRLSKETIGWVEEHDRIDKQRRKQEEKELEREELVKAALSKLSRKERKLLGLR